MKALLAVLVAVLLVDFFLAAGAYQQRRMDEEQLAARRERSIKLRLHYLTDPWVQANWDLYRDSFRDLPPDRVAAALAEAYVNPQRYPVTWPHFGP